MVSKLNRDRYVKNNDIVIKTQYSYSNFTSFYVFRLLEHKIADKFMFKFTYLVPPHCFRNNPFSSSTITVLKS